MDSLLPKSAPASCTVSDLVYNAELMQELFSNTDTCQLVLVLTQLHNTFTQKNGLETAPFIFQKFKNHTKMYPNWVKLWTTSLSI